MPLHKNLTGADLHEPKGVASATANTVYVADGAGSGSWQEVALTSIEDLTALTTAATNASTTAEEAAAAAQAAADAAAAVGGSSVPNYYNVAAAAAATIPAARLYVLVSCHTSAVYGGGAMYYRVAAQPSHQGRFRSVDRYLPDGTTDATNGGWWEIGEKTLTPQMFGAKADGSNDDTNAIQYAISAALSRGTRHVFIPGTSNYYKTTAAVEINDGPILIEGAGRASTIGGHGSFYTFSAYGTSGDVSYGIRIRNLRFADNNKTGGYSLYSEWVAQCEFDKLTIDNSYAGVKLHDFNNVTFSNSVIVSTQVSGAAAFTVTGGGTGDSGRSDVLTIDNVVIGGESDHAGGPTAGKHGILFDGFVHTVTIKKLYLTAIDGVGFWVRNSISASDDPAFFTVYGLESDYNSNAAIYLEDGNRFFFTDTQVHGSYATSNIHVLNGVKKVTFSGGFSSGAGQAGIRIDGQDVAVHGMKFLSNSATGSGGTAGTTAGVYIDQNARYVVISGITSGDPDNPTWQSVGIYIHASADYFTVTGSMFANNVSNWSIGPSLNVHNVFTNNSY